MRDAYHHPPRQYHLCHQCCPQPVIDEESLSSPRIISGKARGIRLQSVPGDTTRPITDRVKEALFNILGADIVDCDFLDIFGGTGSVGIEALSRGAHYARFLDLNSGAVRTIKANLEHTRLVEHSDVFQADAFNYLRRPPDRQFHYLYVAPPQYKGMWEKTMQEIDSNLSWLTADGWVIVQIDPLEYKVMPFVNLVEFEQRKYGSTLLVFYDINQSPTLPETPHPSD
jgi:16S rRNA (guanine(966)-N(2))-methyltransferase RsmD